MPTTVTFAYTGAVQTWPVPATAVSPITLDVRGAGGAFTGDGAGGRVVGTLTVVPGTDVLSIFCGGVGAAAVGGAGGVGGFNGGGTGGPNTGGGLAGFGGSGASDVRKNGTALANRVAVGGGAGSTGRTGSTGRGAGGAGGAATGAAGAGVTGGGGGGGGGTGAAGGAAGAAGSSAGTAGSSGQGGSGPTTTGATTANGGGGGGGFFGGGSGGNATQGGGGGGGGSNYVGGLLATTTNTQGGGSAQGATGTVAITYNQLPLAPTLLQPNFFLAGGGWVYPAWPTVFEWVMNDPDPSETIVTSNFRYRLVGNPTWTTLTGITIGAGGRVGGTSLPAGTLTAGAWEAQAQTVGSDGQTSPFSASTLFTVRTPPAAAYPYADVPDQWPDATALGQLTTAAQMHDRIDDKLNKLARWVNQWANDDTADLVRQCDVGFHADFSVTTSVPPATPAPWDSIEWNGPLQIGVSGFGTLGVWNVTHAGLYFIDAQVRQSGAVSAYSVSLVGLPAVYGVPVMTVQGGSGSGDRITGFYRLAGGEAISVQHNAAAAVNWAVGSTDAGGNSGIMSRFQAWRIGP